MRFFSPIQPIVSLSESAEKRFFRLLGRNVCRTKRSTDAPQVRSIPKRRQAFLEAYEHNALWTIIGQRVTDCRDPKDNKFLEVAINAQATWLISGDTDLLVLHPYNDVQIITPATWLAIDVC